MNVLDIFSGIGGFSLGLQRAGMQPVAFCERDRYARAVLAKHWPDVPIYDDVRTLTGARLRADGIVAVDVICGGFPCQDVSVAGNGAGLDGERSRLWRDFARLTGEIRPRYVLVENVPALRSRGLGIILGDLAALGLDAEWHCIPAAAVGAPHQRDRIWIIAYADSAGLRHGEQRDEGRRNDFQARRQTEFGNNGANGLLADADSWRREGERFTQSSGQQSPRGNVANRFCEIRELVHAEMADADRIAREKRRSCYETQGQARRDIDRSSECTNVADTSGPRLPIPERHPVLSSRWWNARRTATERHWWSVEPAVGRVATGIPRRVDRLRCLGNAVVPQLVEEIGRAIIIHASKDGST